MFETVRQMLHQQMAAALTTLDHAINGCPDSAWNSPVCNHLFCQAAFHALFYTDLYLGRGVETLREQAFHQQHADVFGDYEELDEGPPLQRYERAFLKAYSQHCREKVASILAGETEASLRETSPFSWLPCSRAEVHVYNLRHIQHHAAQLSLRLRLDGHHEVPWVRRG